MWGYIFLITLILIFFFNKDSKIPAFILASSYALYISMTNLIVNDIAYYMALSMQELITGFLVALHYRFTGYCNSKYVAQISFIAVFIHIFGRITYQYDLNTAYYFALSFTVVMSQIILLIIRPLRDGLCTTAYRNLILYFTRHSRQIPIFKMQINSKKEEKCSQI